MSHAISPTPADPQSVTVLVPDPGDNRTAASVANPFSSVWSGVRWLRGVITGGISQAITFAADLVVNGKITTGGKVTAPELAITGDAAIGGNAAITGALSVGNGLDVNGDYFDATDATVALMPPTTFYGAVTFGSDGRIASKVSRLAASVGMTVSPRNVTNVHYTSAASGSTVQIDDTGAVDGDAIWFTNEDTANAVTVKKPDGSTLNFVRSATPYNRSIRVARQGGVWDDDLQVGF
jgi:hypothetical protein